MPLPELQYRLNTLTSLDQAIARHSTQLRDCWSIQRSSPTLLSARLLRRPAEQHDSLYVATWLRNWVLSLLTLNCAMTQSENPTGRMFEDLRHQRIVRSSASGLNTSRCNSPFCSAVTHIGTSVAGRWLGSVLIPLSTTVGMDRTSTQHDCLAGARGRYS